MLLGYLPTWAVYMSVYGAAKDYAYTKTGECRLEEYSEMRLMVRRSQAGRSGRRFCCRRSLLNYRHESYMGYQDSVDVSGRRDRGQGHANTLALP